MGSASTQIMEFKPGTMVKISVAHQFRGYKLGIVNKICKDGHPQVYLVDDTITTRYACVDVERGDTITKITK